MSPRSREFRAFEGFADRLLSIPKETIDQRMAAYRQRAAQARNKRGMKLEDLAARPSSPVVPKQQAAKNEPTIASDRSRTSTSTASQVSDGRNGRLRP